MTDPSPSASATPVRKVTAALVAVVLASSGCRAPVAFYRPGHGPSDAPVVGLGAPAPYVPPPPADPADGPAGDAAGVYAATTGPSLVAGPLRHLPQRLYVPDSRTGGVTVLNARTLRPVGRLRPSVAGPVQLTAAPDLRGLWLNDTTRGAVVPVLDAVGRVLRDRPSTSPSGEAGAGPRGGRPGGGGVFPQDAVVREVARAEVARADVARADVARKKVARKKVAQRLPVPGTLYFAPDTQASVVVSARGRQVDVEMAASAGQDGRTGGTGGGGGGPKGRAGGTGSGLKGRAGGGAGRWAAVRLPCAGKAADFSADASLLAVSCTGARRVVRLDARRGRVDAARVLPAGTRPSGVRLLPDGSQFAVADAGWGGVWLLDARDFETARFVRTSAGASALVLSRDARSLYVAGPSEVTVLDVASRQVTAHWRVPGSGGLAAGGVSVDGRTLWLTRPSTGTLIALDTRTGAPERSVHVGGHPAAPLPFPQPGRRSLGGPGIYR